MAQGSSGISVQSHQGYECAICHEVFARACKLRQHIRIHSEGYSEEDEASEDTSPSYYPYHSRAKYKKKRRSHCQAKRRTSLDKGKFVPYKKWSRLEPKWERGKKGAKGAVRKGEAAWEKATSSPGNDIQRDTFLCEACGALLTFTCKLPPLMKMKPEYPSSDITGCENCQILRSTYEGNEHQCSACGWAQCPRSEVGVKELRPSVQQGPREPYYGDKSVSAQQQMPPQPERSGAPPAASVRHHHSHDYTLQPYQDQMWLDPQFNADMRNQVYIYNSPQYHYLGYCDRSWRAAQMMQHRQNQRDPLHSNVVVGGNRSENVVYKAPRPPTVPYDNGAGYVTVPMDGASFYTY